jgi:hypothetical protein
VAKIAENESLWFMVLMISSFRLAVTLSSVSKKKYPEMRS